MNDIDSAAHPRLEPLDASGSVELAVLERSGMIESRHLGAAVALAPDGSVLRSYGDSDALVYPRSSLKPLQAIAVLRSGLELTDEQLVLATASHTG
ncbi:MAG: asparaginase, partial [Lacisediminihabitans sp.]